MANLFEQANERKKWDATIAQVGQMGYPQNPAQPPAFTSPQPRRPNSFGDAAAATSNPGVTQLPPSATLASAVPGAPPQAAPTAPNPTDQRLSMGTPPAQPASTSGGLNAPWWSGEYATAARLSDKSGLELEQQRAAAATPVQAPANDPVKRIINTGTLSMPQAVTKPADAAPAAPAAPNPTDQRLAMGTQTAQPTAPALPTTSAPAPSAQPAGNEIAPGVYRNAPGQYSDNAQGMNMPAGFTGRPNQQNMAAAANLAASQQAPTGRSMAEAALSQPSGVQAPVVRNSTNDWAARNNLRNASVSASSITNNGGKFDRSGPGDSAAMAEYKAALATDQALQQAQPGADITAMRENAGIQREGMQQQGSTARDAERNAISRDELGLRRTAAGFQNRAAQRMEDLSGVLLDPNATPEQRSVAQRNLAALSGKTAADRMQTVTLPDTTNEMGQVVRGGQALVRTLEDGTVQQVPIGAQQGAAMPPGMTKQVGTSNGRPVYEDAKGNRYVG